MSASVLPVLVRAEEVHHDIPMSPVAFAAITFALFLVALGVLWTFRKTYAKVPQRGGPGPGQSGHGHSDPGAHH